MQYMLSTLCYLVVNDISFKTVEFTLKFTSFKYARVTYYLHRQITMFQEVNNESQIPNGKNKPGSDGSKYGRMDLADFVTEVDRFSTLIEPIALVVYFIEDIRR